ncbi:MAG: OmpA family protein [Rhodobacteraceae bacterium]|nr:OmpA family protein [Paracoccaceae bacterium]
MRARAAAVLAALAVLAAPAQAAEAFLPEGARLAHERTGSEGWHWARGAWEEGGLPSERVSGPVLRQVLHCDRPTGGREARAAGLRATLQEAGYVLVFECAARECGGFDFRFAADILPEPEMHVDLSAFRYLAAEDAAGAEKVAVVLSRGSGRAYVEISRAGLAEGAMPVASTRSPDPGAAGPVEAITGDVMARGAPPPPQRGGEAALADTLLERGAVVLEDVAFDVGAASLTGALPGDVAALAAWLLADPERRVTLVGHTDATGALAGNVALSRRRADAVRDALITLGVPGDQLAAEGVGYLAPRAANLTEEGRTLNRRVEAVLTSLP